MVTVSTSSDVSRVVYVASSFKNNIKPFVRRGIAARSTINPGAAPWPSMRGNMRNAGCEPALLRPTANAPMMPIRVWRTHNSVFSTPIVGAGDVIYVGSADKHFYAFNPKTGQRLWAFRTDECIDSAACIGRDGTLYVPSCDGRVYALSPDGKELGRFDALRQRPGFTPSTIYWWEGNLELGPDGCIYGGNDNFYLYAWHPDLTVKWTRPTGMNVWSAPAFDDTGHLYGASFDMHVFCLDTATGAQRWRVNTGNLVAASPALGPDNDVYIANLGGTISRLHCETGAVQWTMQTEGHVYASVAVAPDGRLHVGSADGRMYCLEAATGKVLGTFFTGDAIRSSAAIGPDPEGKQPYLVYFGGGNGILYALEPSLRRRWSYDTAQLSGGQDEYRNINASVALGEQGLTTASANGTVMYVPYGAYLHQQGFVRDRTDGFPRDGEVLGYVSAGGAWIGDPQQPIAIKGAQTLTFRLLSRANGQTRNARLMAADAPTETRPAHHEDHHDGVDVRIQPPLAHHVIVQPNGEHLAVELLEVPKSGQHYDVTVSAKVRHDDGSVASARTQIGVHLARVHGAPDIEALLQMPLQVSHMSIFDPSVVPSFDQIGIASLKLDLQVIEVDRKTSAVAAWGVLSFGADEGGQAVGVPKRRHLLFAFNGTYRDGHITLESTKPWFEITALPIPLDRLRITGVVPSANQRSVDGGSLVAEVQLPSWNSVLGQTLRGQRPAAWRALTEAREASRSGAAAWRNNYSHTWLVLRQSFMLAWQLIFGGVHRAWQLLDPRMHFTGLGTYRLSRGETTPPSPLPVTSLRYDSHLRTVTAVLPWQGDQATLPVLGIALVDAQTGRLLGVDYNSATRVTHDPRGKCVQVQLRVPEQVGKDGRHYKAVFMRDCNIVGNVVVP